MSLAGCDKEKETIYVEVPVYDTVYYGGVDDFSFATQAGWEIDKEGEYGVYIICWATLLDTVNIYKNVQLHGEVYRRTDSGGVIVIDSGHDYFYNNQGQVVVFDSAGTYGTAMVWTHPTYEAGLHYRGYITGDKFFQ